MVLAELHVSKISSKLAELILVVLGLSIVLPLIAFRSPLIPVQAAAVAVLLASAMVLSLARAMLTLFGRAVWWLPGWLSKLLPHVNIEGEAAPPIPGPAVAPWVAARRPVRRLQA